jgi:hypothetical protein
MTRATRFALVVSSLFVLVACAPDPVQQAYDRCVSSAVNAARANSGGLKFLTDEQKKQLEGTAKSLAKGTCGAIKSVCQTDRTGQACRTLLQTAGVQP